MMKRVCLGILTVVFWQGASGAIASKEHIDVSMRLIGHEILLMAHDSTSRILPIEHEQDTHTIRFSSNFSYDPDNLFQVIDSIIKLTKIAENYAVLVLECETKEIVYAYEVGKSVNENFVPCLGRIQPKGCFYIEIIFKDKTWVQEIIDKEQAERITTKVPGKKGRDSSVWITSGILGLTLIGFLVFVRRRQKQESINSNLISIGRYRFNTSNLVLKNGQDTVRMTSKEADLLVLLYQFANQTVERATILQKVWGDEGTYDGRTLDVYISKLRKKLEGDPGIEIINARGIGYKLVLEQ